MANKINKLPAITKAAELAARQFAALKREAAAVANTESEKRKRGIRIVSTTRVSSSRAVREVFGPIPGRRFRDPTSRLNPWAAGI